MQATASASATGVQGTTCVSPKWSKGRMRWLTRIAVSQRATHTIHATRNRRTLSSSRSPETGLTSGVAIAPEVCNSGWTSGVVMANDLLGGKTNLPRGPLVAKP